MCGIAGYITSRDDFTSDHINDILLRAEKAQIHRGPDRQGVFLHNHRNWKIGFGHQRVANLDLSEAGNQPMVFTNRKDVIIYNGKVYNYKEIRVQLESKGYNFQSNSDTEVVLAALHYWGPDEALNMFNGMFSFAWFDADNNRIVVARDRLGVKPFYYFLKNNRILFASELKTILAMTQERFSLNYQIIGEYLVQSLQDTSTSTFFNDIIKLPAGSYGIINLHNINLCLQITPYWSIPPKDSVFDNGNNENKVADNLKELFFDSVKLRLQSDVPVGVLLSGGLDSSAIAAAVQTVLGRDAEFNLLSAVSDNTEYDETPFIDMMGRHLNRKVNKINLDFTAQEALGYLEEACWYNDEPVGSFSNVAHYLLMKKAHELGIRVILSGQGADELLCGYKKYVGFLFKRFLDEGDFYNGFKFLWSFIANKSILNQYNFAEAQRYLPSIMKLREKEILGESLKEFTPLNLGLAKGMTLEERQVLDLTRFSVPTLLHYEDRMSTAHSREIRVPFLDYRIVEFLVHLPPSYKLNKGWTKYIFRKAMESSLPPEITWRKDKQGFVNPQGEWLKGYLKEQVLNYFSPDSLIFKYKIINREELIKKYEAYCRKPKGGQVWFREIFNPLSLEIWLRKYEGYIA